MNMHTAERIKMYTLIPKTVYNRVKVSFDDFIKSINERKPQFIWNVEWSKQQPLYEITGYEPDGVFIFCYNWADKNSVFKTWSELWDMVKYYTDSTEY